MENLTTQLGELFSAIQRSDVHQVRRLLSVRVSPNQCNADGRTALMVASSIGNPTIIQMLCAAAATHKPPEQIFLESGITAPAHPTTEPSTLLSPALDSYPPAAVLANAKHSPAAYSAILSQPKPELPLPDYASTLSTLTDRTLIDSVLKSTSAQPQPALSPGRPGTVVETSATTASKTVGEGLMGLATKGMRALTGKRNSSPKRPLYPHQPVPRPVSQENSPINQANKWAPGARPPIDAINLDAASINAAPTTHAPNGSKPKHAHKIEPEKTDASDKKAPDIEDLALEALLHGNINQLPEIAPDQPSLHQPSSDHPPLSEDCPDDLEFPDAFADIESIIRPGQKRTDRQNPPTLRTPVPISKTSPPDVDSDDLDTSFLAQTPHVEPSHSNGYSNSGQANAGQANSGQGSHQDKPEIGEQTPLEIAVKRNDVATVMSLLKAGVDFRPSTWYDTPVLVTAAAMGHAEIVQILIAQGANVNNGYDHLPLHSAAANGHLGVAQMLLNAGAYIHGREENGKTALIVAAAHGHLQVVQMLMERGADTRAVSQGETAMTMAARNGHQAVYNYLQLGQMPPQGQMQDQVQGQMQGQMQRPNLYEEQIQDIQGIPDNPLPSPSQPPFDTRPGQAPAEVASADHGQKLVEVLMYAAADGHLPRLRQALADGADVNGVGDDWGSGPIHSLDRDANDEREPAPNNGRHNGRRTALSVAVQAGHISLIEALLDANADPNKPDESVEGGPTLYPIIAAACSSSAIHRSDIIRLLLLQGARINQTDERGRSALMHAISAHHLDAIAALIAANADLNIKDLSGRDALDYAQATDHSQIIQLLEQAKQQQQQATELLKAITQGNTHKVQQLLAAGINPNAVAEGMSALNQAAAKGYVAIAQQLISAGADINGRANAFELNPLLYAAYRGHFEMVKLLISVGVDIHAEVDNHFNALSYAYLGQQQKRNTGKPFGAIIHVLETQGLRAPTKQ